MNEKPDIVNEPPHYKAGGIETIDYLRAKLGHEGFVAYCRGNALKYLSRAGEKGDAAEDARKAAWYARRMAEELEARTGIVVTPPMTVVTRPNIVSGLPPRMDDRS